MPILPYQNLRPKTILALELDLLIQFGNVWKHDLDQQSCI